MDTTNALTLYDRITDPLAAMHQIGAAIAKSGFAGCDRLEQGQVIALTCLCERITPVQFCRKYHLVDGKPSLKAHAALAEFRRLGGKHRWLKTGDDGQEAEAEFTWEGQTIRERFTIDDALRQKLVKPNSNWEKTPANMLRARVISNAIAMLAPEIYAGEEQGDAAPAAEPAPLLPPPKPANVVEVKFPATTLLSPSTQVVIEPAKEGPPPAPAAEAQVGTPDSVLASKFKKLEEVIGANLDKAVEWLTAKRWIKDSLLDLPEDRVDRILAKPDVFLKTIGAA